MEDKRTQKLEYQDFEFKKNFYTFNNFGYTTNPQNNEIVQNDQVEDNQYKSVFEKQNKRKRDKFQQQKQRRLINNDPGSSMFAGPWAKFEGEQELEVIREGAVDENQQLKLDQLQERHQRKTLELGAQGTQPTKQKREVFISEPRVVKNQDIDIAQNQIKPDPNQQSYLPKKCVKVLAGHTDKIEGVKYFPDSGHLALSCSLDSTIKIWDTYNTKKCLQTYIGHNHGVRDIQWVGQGLSFVSSAFDGVVRQWDTQTGQVINTFTCRRIPYCIRVNPSEPSSMIVGTNDRRIVQYDMRSGKKALIYQEHLGAICGLCFVDNDKKFISSSDDKKMFLWEFGIPVVAKHISEPSLNTVTFMQQHPNQRHFIGQSLDNKLVVFEARGGFRHNRRKNFLGHENKGYACATTFSPDGRFVASGDANGRIWFWDWRTTRNYRTLEAHEDICIGVDWNPAHQSQIISGGWDGVLKIWN